MEDQEDRYALVTGASTGIGYQLAKLIAGDGKNLVLVSKDKNRLELVKKEFEDTYRIRVKILIKDLSQLQAPFEIFSELEKEKISIDLLVNNAGFGVYGEFAETNLQKELEMIQVNIASLTHLTKLFINDMLRNKSGKILNLASTGAFQPGPFTAVYCASKSYVLNFSEALASELEGTGVTLTCLCPGPTKTAFYRKANMENSKIARGRLLDDGKVARAGYRALKKGKAVAIPGLKNKLLVFLSGIAPRNLVTKTSRSMLERHKEIP